MTTVAGIEGRVALVTGTSSGLGPALRPGAGRAGARLVLASRRHEADRDLAAQLHDACPVACDVRLAADREALVSAAVERFGQIDILVNNAGVAYSGPPGGLDLRAHAARAAAPARRAGRAAAVPGRRRLQLCHRADPGGGRRLDLPLATPQRAAVPLADSGAAAGGRHLLTKR